MKGGCSQTPTFPSCKTIKYMPFFLLSEGLDFFEARYWDHVGVLSGFDEFDRMGGLK